MAQSSELSGGAGFTFEDAVVAIYLAALLGEDPALGLPGRVGLAPVSWRGEGLGSGYLE
jgi:hypothetical protein